MSKRSVLELVDPWDGWCPGGVRGLRTRGRGQLGAERVHFLGDEAGDHRALIGRRRQRLPDGEEMLGGELGDALAQPCDPGVVEHRGKLGVLRAPGVELGGEPGGQILLVGAQVALQVSTSCTSSVRALISSSSAN